MSKQVPAYIRKEIVALQNALNAVAKHADILEQYAAKHIGEDMAQDFFHDCSLDNPYEFDAQRTFDEIENIINGDY